MAEQRRARTIAEQRADEALDRFGERWRQVLEDATVNVVCAPEDADRIAPWIDQQRQAWPVPVVLRTSVFLRPGTALYWQPDGVHAPSTPRTLAVRLPGSS